MRALSPPAGSRSDPLYGLPVIGPHETVTSVGDALTGAVLGPAGRAWRRAAAGALVLTLACAGLGFVRPVPVLDEAGGGWWIGLACGCLMISGLLRLADVEWRCGIDRLSHSAAPLCAGIAALHPLPVHPLGRAALLTVALALWGAALIPDLAALRDRATAGFRSGLYRMVAAGWRGSAGQWLVWTRACRGLALLGILAAIAVLLDLALTGALHPQRPDSLRQDTLRPVALLIEAVLAGAGLIAALALALQRIQGLDGLVTGRHRDILGRLILVFGLAALYAHITEIATVLLHGDAAERAATARRLLGDEAPAFWTLMLAGLLPSQLFWIGAVRRNPVALGLIGAAVAAGLRADHGGLAAAASESGLAAGMAGLIGAVGLFALGLLLAFRLVPPVSIAETRQLTLIHNRARDPRAVPRMPGSAPVIRSGLVAVFAAEACLAEAARGLTVLDHPPRLDAFAPVPMPEAAAALHRSERALSGLALAGAGLGAAAFLLARALMPDAPDAPVTAISWALLAVPALSAAALGGTLGIGLTLLALRAGIDAPPPASLAEHFVLTVEPATKASDPSPSDPGSSDPSSLAALAQRLRAMPETAGRPLALYGPAAPGPRR